MIQIRLSRQGAKNNPFYRIVAVDRKRKNKGKPLDVIGYWRPKKKAKIDKDRFGRWIAKGAKPSARVLQLIK